tara:strand:- start:3130 stop:3399 length:270 start_codon:yes stop_codon:yes gene_type:complete
MKDLKADTEFKGRSPKYNGCRSYNLHVIDEFHDCIFDKKSMTLGSAMYWAGRFMEMALTDGICIDVSVFDRKGKEVLNLENCSKQEIIQ